MFYIVQAGSALQVINTAGDDIQTLTLPVGVTIDAEVNGEFVILARQIVFIKASSVNLRIDPLTFDVTPLCVPAPLAAPTVAAGATTGLTGAYRAAFSYLIKDGEGQTIVESPMSPTSDPVTLADDSILISNITVSPTSEVNARRVYRTAAGGTVLFDQQDIDDNTTTSVDSEMSDELLAIRTENQNISNPPGTDAGSALGLAVVWKNRIWACGTAPDEVDEVLWTEPGAPGRWGQNNGLFASPPGGDEWGVQGFLPRRDFLGVAKRNSLQKIAGDSNDDFQMTFVAEGSGIGCIAPKTCVIIQDKAYFLGIDGVYRWDDGGVVSLTENVVDPWFTTDTYFNRSRFPLAFAKYNEDINTYELHLASAASDVENVWIGFAIDADGGRGAWLGPHSTRADTSTAAALLQGANSEFKPAIGTADGRIFFHNQAGANDVGPTDEFAIASAVETRWHAEKAPDIDHFWGQLSILSRIEASLAPAAEMALTITPYVGRVDVAASATMTATLTLGRERLDRIGVGALCKLRFEQDELEWRWLLYGYEIKPVFEVGWR